MGGEGGCQCDGEAEAARLFHWMDGEGGWAEDQATGGLQGSGGLHTLLSNKPAARTQTFLAGESPTQILASATPTPGAWSGSGSLGPAGTSSEQVCSGTVTPAHSPKPPGVGRDGWSPSHSLHQRLAKAWTRDQEDELGALGRSSS